MNKGRLEAFSDGVIAIIITIMVLEMKATEGANFEDLKPIIPKFLSYVLSFIYVGIYWSNHHHMMHTVKKVTGGILWANLHLLFWLSLIPFVTAWLGENHFAKAPMVLYGIVLLMDSIAYFILQQTIIKHHGSAILQKAIGKDIKGNLSTALYVLGIIACWFSTWVAGGIYIFVALMWLVPDKRIETVLEDENH